MIEDASGNCLFAVESILLGDFFGEAAHAAALLRTAESIVGGTRQVM